MDEAQERLEHVRQEHERQEHERQEHEKQEEQAKAIERGITEKARLEEQARAGDHPASMDDPSHASSLQGKKNDDELQVEGAAVRSAVTGPRPLPSVRKMKDLVRSEQDLGSHSRIARNPYNIANEPTTSETIDLARRKRALETDKADRRKKPPPKRLRALKEGQSSAPSRSLQLQHPFRGLPDHYSFRLRGVQRRATFSRCGGAKGRHAGYSLLQGRRGYLIPHIKKSVQQNLVGAR